MALSSTERSHFNDLMEKIAKCREHNGKPTRQYVCVADDWPEYEQVWKMIEERVENTHLHAPVDPEPTIVSAEFTQSRNDLHWELFDGEDGFIRWTGYNDNNWWVNVAPKTRERIGPVTGKKYTIDYHSGRVVLGSPKVAPEDAKT